MHNLEIERKFLLKDCDIVTILQFSNLKYNKIDIIQAYIEVREDYTKRVRKENDRYVMTIKTGSDPLQREEEEKYIDKDEFERLLPDSLGVIEKTRYKFETNEFKEIVVDVFVSPVNFKVAEIEYKKSEDIKKLQIPQWLEKLTEKEVTKDKRYLNANIALKGHQK
ncbi:MAG: CYTH domain-containing protein [Campylobacterota bacterium]